jgi:O-antigen/teichoic acid export membrane protein
MDFDSTYNDTGGLVREQLALNSFSGVVQFVIVSTVYFFAYPLLLKSLGPERFGLWALLGLPSQYVLLGGFGLSNALVKFLAETSPGGGPKRQAELVGSTAAIFVVIGSVLMLAAFTWQRSIISWLHISPGLVLEAQALLVGMACVVCISLLATVYTSVLSGMHRMDLANGVQTLGAAMTGVGVFAAVKLGWGLVGLMLVNAFSASAMFLAALFLSRRMTRMRWRIVPKVKWKTVVSLLQFGIHIYVAALFAMLLEPTIKILLGRFAGLETVSSFEIASRAATQVRSLFFNVMIPILPASSLLMNDAAAIRGLFVRAMRLLWLTAIPVFLAISVLSARLIQIWLGRPFPLAATALSVLSIAWLLNILAIPPYLLVQGMNKPRYAMMSSVLQGVISAGAAYVLIPYLGLRGAVYCELVGLAVGAIYIFRCFEKLCPVKFQDVLAIRPSRAFGMPAAFAVVVFVASLFTGVSFWQVAILCIVSFVVYASILFTENGNGFTAATLLASYLPRSRKLKTPPQNTVQERINAGRENLVESLPRDD